MKKIFLAMMVVVAIAVAIAGCDRSYVMNDVNPNPPENKEQIRTEQEDTRDSVPPGHHPENDDDDPYGGKYDPIWLH